MRPTNSKLLSLAFLGLLLMNVAFGADPKPAKAKAKGVKGTPAAPVPPPPPPAECIFELDFMRFRQVVGRDLLKHVLDEKNPDIWNGATGPMPDGYRITFDPLTYRIHVTSPIGAYDIVISAEVDETSLGKLIDGHLPRVLVQNHGLPGARGVATATIGIHPNWLKPEIFADPVTGPRHMENLRGLLRAGFAADPYLHPQQRSPDVPRERPFTESAVQQVTLQEMTNLYRFSQVDDAGRACRIGLMAPGGLGKTFLSARFMSRVFEAKKLVLVVDNNDILDQAQEDYAREFGVRIGAIQTIYDRNSRRALDPNLDIVLINRTMLHRRWDDVVTWMGDARTGFVFDEAHHLGRSTGAQEFREIFNRFNTDPRMLANIKRNPGRPHYLGLLTSATFWHGDEELITNADFLGVRNLPKGTKPYGKIYGPLLYDSETVTTTRGLFNRGATRSTNLGTELECLRHGLATPELARRQLLRAMGQGHLARLSHSDLHDDVINGPGGASAHAFEVVRSIDNQSIKVERTNIAHSLLEKVYEHLRGMRTHATGDIASALTPDQIATLAAAPNRALILVRRTEVANAVRDALRAIALARGDKETEVRAVHSADGSDDREDSLAWFRDRGRYANAEEQSMNKLLVVDQMINEGVDVPKTNAVVLLRHFSVEDEGSMRRLIQIITRASRTAELKTHVEIIDFSGASSRLREILNIGTQAYGGGGGGGGGGSTRIEVDIRPGTVRETINRVTFINAQPTSLSPFSDEADRWLVMRAPFDDPRVEGEPTQSSPLAVQLLSLAHALPAREVTAGYLIFHHEALKGYKDNRLKELLSRTGPRFIQAYQTMRQLYTRFRAEALHDTKLNVTKAAALADVEAQLKEQWFEMLTVGRELDFYRKREVTLSFSPLQGEKDASAKALASWMEYVVNLKDLKVTQDGDPAKGPAMEVLGRPLAGAGNTWELIARGDNAYSYLAGELGTHVLHVSNDGRKQSNYVFLRVTPPLDSKDPLRKYVDEEHAAAERLFRQDAELGTRRVYGAESIRRDRELPSFQVPLVRTPPEGGPIEMRESEAAYRQLGRMLRMNHYNYLRSTIQHILLPAILNQQGG